jgi:hypothetical protein
MPRLWLMWIWWNEMAKLFDYVSTINKKVGVYPDDNLEEFESVYEPYVVNMAFCRYPDTIEHVDFLVSNPNLTKRQHFDYLYYSVPKKNRYEKWNKVDDDIRLETISAVYNYSINKAREVVDLFSDEDLELLKTKLIKGGRA